MPRSTKSPQHEECQIDNNLVQEDSSAPEESSSSDHEPDQEVFLQPSQAQPQLIPNMFIPYIEVPKMDWTVNDDLYHRFLKWHLKCENILECELAMLSERRKCKKVVAWSGDFGIDQYVSCNLSNEELTLDTIWENCEEFCKPQSNVVRARFDFLTGFQ